MATPVDGPMIVAVAAAGYGKTTALRRRFPRARWFDGTMLYADGSLADAVAQTTADVTVVDNVPRLAPGELAKIAGLVPAGATVALATRFSVCAEDAMSVRMLGPADLALGEDEASDLLAAEYGVADPWLADRIWRVTGGWPALVRLAAQTLGGDEPSDSRLLTILGEPIGQLRSYVESAVLGDLPEGTRRLLHDIADLSPVTTELCEALGHPRAAAHLASLRQIGIASGTRLIPVIGHLLRSAAEPVRHRRTTMTAAGWYAEHGMPGAAVRAFAGVEAYDEAAAVLDDHGPVVLASGQAALIADVLSTVPADRARRMLLGDALRVSGRVIDAARVYAEAAAEGWDAGLAWRTGLVHYLRGDSRAALTTFAAYAEPAAPTVDGALLLGWACAARLQLGEVDEATATAREAVAAAEAVGDDTALATAYIGLSLCLNMAGATTEGDELMAQATQVAERLDDAVLRARVLTNQTYRLLREARYRQALDAARRSEQSARVAGHANLHALALCNEADALTMLGRFDDAIRRYERAIALSRRMGSRRSAAAQLGLGEVYRRRGWTEQARAAYETARQLAADAGNLEFAVNALTGLAIVLAPDDVEAAAQAADEAVRSASPGLLTTALLGRAWVAAHAGDRTAAADLADRAAARARAEGDRAALAGALELRAMLHADHRAARTALREAEAIWAAADAAVEAARVRCLIGALPRAGTDDRLAGLLAADVLSAAGVEPEHTLTLARRWSAPGAAVRIHAFGRFEVVVDGEPVPAAQWQSRKARDLLRILVAQRGRPIARAQLSELLWPDDDPSRTGHRLSVLMSIVRGVLDPDRSFGADHYLLADHAGVALDIGRVAVDVEEFLAEVGHGRRLRDRGAVAQAYAVLSAADGRYRADVFADDPYADWAQPLREQARAARLAALRMLAATARSLGDRTAAVAYLLQLLAVDPFDEMAHRDLVDAYSAAGQHGEARRAYARYREAMAELGVHPADEYQLPMQSP